MAAQEQEGRAAGDAGGSRLQCPGPKTPSPTKLPPPAQAQVQTHVQAQLPVQVQLTVPVPVPVLVPMQTQAVAAVDGSAGKRGKKGLPTPAPPTPPAEAPSADFFLSPPAAAGYCSSPPLPLPPPQLVYSTGDFSWPIMPLPLPPPPPPLDESLTRSILAYNQFVASNTRVHLCVLGQLLHAIQPLVGELWKGARVHVYGSLATGLAVPFSDIDLVIRRHGDAEKEGAEAVEAVEEVEGAEGAVVAAAAAAAPKIHKNLVLPLPYNHNPSSQEVIVGLWTLSGRLREMPWVQSVSPIPRAAIPIIKLDARVGVLMAAACAALAATSAAGEVFDMSGIASDAALASFAHDPAVQAFAHDMDTIPIDITIEAGEHKVCCGCLILSLIHI